MSIYYQTFYFLLFHFGTVVNSYSCLGNMIIVGSLSPDPPQVYGGIQLTTFCESRLPLCTAGCGGKGHEYDQVYTFMVYGCQVM